MKCRRLITKALVSQISCGLTEMFRVKEIAELALEHFHRLFSSALLRLGTSVALLPPEEPGETAKEKRSKSKGPRVDPQRYWVSEVNKEMILKP